MSCAPLKTASGKMCSDVSLSQGEDVEGSAGQYDHFIMIGVPLPWERDVWSSRHGLKEVGEVIQEANSLGIRVRAQGVVPRVGDAGPEVTIIHYAHKDPASPTYERREYRVPRSQVAPLVRAVLLEDKDFDYRKFAVLTETHRELFVCTHGSRDVCCAKQGFPIFEALQGHASKRMDAAVVVWRTSHLGGHRFAPTLLDFPRGILWGRVTEAKGRALLDELATNEQLASMYRGWSAIKEIAQIAEHALIKRDGWDWLNRERSAEIVGASPVFEVNFRGSDNGSTRWTQTVAVQVTGTVQTLTNTGATQWKEMPVFTAKIRQHGPNSDKEKSL